MQIAQEGSVTNLHFAVRPGWEQWMLLTSDNHYDSVYCNRDLLTRHLNQAVSRRALIAIFGDWFDAMQGRFDPRRSNNELRPEFRRDDYYDMVPEDSGNYLAPYSRNLLIWAKGNHCTAVLKNNGTDLVARAVKYMNLKYGSDILTAGYGGWINFFFHPEGTEKVTVKKLKYFHGAGSEAPVTKGAIQTNRQAVYLPDADYVVNGHNHWGYYIPIERERIDDEGKLSFHMQHHLRIPGYKQSYGDGSGGWEVERGNSPKPLGSWWLHMFYDEEEGVIIQPTAGFGDPQPMTPPVPDLVDQKGPVRSEDPVDF